MGARAQGMLQGATAGGKAGGGWSSLIGGAIGLMQGDKQQGQQDLADMQDAMQQGQQKMADMRNGLEMDDNDRSLVANSVDNGFGGFGGF